MNIHSRIHSNCHFSSKRVSSPAYGFGSSTRDQLRKIYASNGTGATPGPAAYAPKASVGKGTYWA